MLDRANIAVDKEHLVTAVTDLASRVDDWKSHKVETFGELLRFGTFTVIKGDGGKDAEREVRIASPAIDQEDWRDLKKVVAFHHVEIPASQSSS